MLKLCKVEKNYHQDRGLKSINMTIQKGTLNLFVGSNGSGKSTTLKLIGHVIFHKKQQGTIINQFERMIYLPDKRSYPKLLKVKTYLNYFLEKKIEDAKLAYYLDRYQLPDKPIGGLSKGMLQKLGILQSLLSEGDLYLLDEPTDGLDKASIELFKEDLLLRLKENKTFIISTHNRNLFRDLKPIVFTFKEGVCK